MRSGKALTGLRRAGARAPLVCTVICTVIAFALPSGARAQADTTARSPRPDSADARDPHAVQPERPTVATHAGTVATGWVEIETGVEHDQISPGAAGIQQPTVIKVGIASAAQLSIFGTSLRPAGSTFGLGDVGAGVKWRLLNDAPVVGDFAILPSVTFPTGSQPAGRGAGVAAASLLLISSHDFGAVSVDVNAGYTRRAGTGSLAPTTATLWTASFGGPVGGALGWTAECYGFPGTAGPAGEPPIVALLGGPTYLARTWLAFDAGIIVPLAGPQPHAIYAGGVYNIGRLW